MGPDCNTSPVRAPGQVLAAADAQDLGEHIHPDTDAWPCRNLPLQTWDSQCPVVDSYGVPVFVAERVLALLLRPGLALAVPVPLLELVAAASISALRHTGRIGTASMAALASSS